MALDNPTEPKQMQGALQTSEETLRTLFEFGPDAYYVSDLEGNLVDANRAAEEITGYEREELVGKNLLALNLLPPRQIPKAAAALAKNAQGQPTGPDEFVVNRKDGTQLAVEIKTSPLEIQGRTLVLGAVRDITDQRRAEEALRESETQIRKRLQEQTTLREAMAIISSTLDVPTVLTRIAEQMCIAIDATSAYIASYDAETKTSTTLAEYVGPEACPEERVSDFGHTYEDVDPEFLSDLHANRHHTDHVDDPDLSEMDRAYMLQYGAKSILHIPLWIREQVLGYAEVWDSRRRREFTPDEIALCQDIAHSAALAIENARLYKAAQQELVERKRAQEALAKAKDGLETTVEERTTELRIAIEQLRQEISERNRAEEALRESQEKLRNLFDSATDGIFAMDLHGTYTEVNQRVVEMHGLSSKDEILGKSGFEFVAPHDIERAKVGMKEVLERGAVVRQVYSALKADGSQFPLEVSGAVLKDASANPVGIMGIARDITERKLAEEELQRLKEFNESIVQTMGEGIAVLDAQGYITLVNPSTADLLGYNTEELVNQHWTAIVPTDQQPLVEAADVRRARGESDRYELDLVRKDGVRVPVLVSGSPRFEGGRFAGTMAVFTHITELKRAEAEIRRRSEELSILLDAAQTLASSLDVDQALENIARHAKALTQADGSRIHLLEPDEKTLRALVVLDDYAEEMMATPLTVGQGIIGQVAATAAPEIVNHAESDPRAAQIPGMPPERGCLMCVPLAFKGEVIGVVTVSRNSERQFKGADAELLTLFASHAAIAIENVRLYAQQERKLTEMTALYDTSLDIVSQLELPKVLRSIAERATSLLGAAAAAVFLYHPEKEELELVVDYNQPKDFAGSKLRVGEGLSGKVVQSGEPVMVEDYRHWDERSQQYDSIHIGGMIGVPLKWAGEIIGVINVSEIEKPRPFQDEDLSLLTLFANQAAIAIENARLFEETKRLADTDALTGLWSRRHFRGRLELELSRARRFGYPLSVLVIDIDNLKLFNDTYGHPAGDHVIRTVAQAIVSACREVDIVGRYGGDEFAIILLEADGIGAAAAASRILATIDKQPFEASDGAKVPVSISIGAASYPSDGDQTDQLLSLADGAMYTVKVTGGGQFASLKVRPEGLPEDLDTPLDVLKGLLITVDAKDHYTFKHSHQVARRALALARAVGFSDQEMRSLDIAGQLHDLGKIGVRTDILRKPGSLTPEEWKMIHQHPRLGHMLLHQVPEKEEVLKAVLHHHERYDGMGYPDGLKGEEIPLQARILGVVDAFSAMIADRPYRKALTVEQALDELRRNAGKQFDPELAEKFIELVETGEVTT